MGTPASGRSRPSSPRPAAHESREQARSWLQWAITPLISALKREHGFLERGFLSWRFYNRQLDYLGPVAFYLDQNGSEALDDLLRRHGELRGPIGQHDTSIARLETCAVACFEALIGNSWFHKEVGRELEAYRSRDTSAQPTGAYPVERLPDLVAERIINQTPALSAGDFADAEFWTAARDRLLREFRTGAPFESLSNALGDALACSARLADLLRTLRESLADRHKIPFVPAGAGP